MRRSPRILTAAFFAVSAASAVNAAAPAASSGGGVVSGVDVGVGDVAGVALSRETSERAVKALPSSVRALWRPGQLGPSVLTGLAVSTSGATPTAHAVDFVQQQQGLLGVLASDLVPGTVRALKTRDVVEFQQMHAGKKVWHHSLAVTVDHGGNVIAVSNDASAVADVKAAVVSVEAAQKTAIAAAGNVGGSGGEVVVVSGVSGAFEAAVFVAATGHGLDSVEVVVNLVDGTVASITPLVRR